jgi:hypothetical protein
VDWTAEDDVMADEDASAVEVVAVAVIKTIEHENVVEWGTADEVASFSHSQSSSPSSHSPPPPLSSTHSQSSLISVHLSPGPSEAGVGDAMKATDVCDAVLETAVLADVLDAVAVADMTAELGATPEMQRRAVSS